MKLKKTIIPLLSILTFSTVLTACGATAASSLTPNLANSDVPSAQVMSVKNTVTPTSNDNGKGNDVVQDALSGGECSDPLEFWEISEYENWMKTELEKNQNLPIAAMCPFMLKMPTITIFAGHGHRLMWICFMSSGRNSFCL